VRFEEGPGKLSAGRISFNILQSTQKFQQTIKKY
jgi:hypothetical protein